MEYIILDDFLPDEVISAANAQGYLRELVRCKDCYYSEHLDSYSVLDKQLFRCCHVSQIGQDKPKMHTGDWFCAYGQLVGRDLKITNFAK